MRSRLSPFCFLVPLIVFLRVGAHDTNYITHRFDAGNLAEHSGPRLTIEVLDDKTQSPTPARLTFLIDGAHYQPPAIGEHGIRFVSIHEGKQQIQTITYARGTGPVEIPLPNRTSQVEVHVAKAMEYLPTSKLIPIHNGTANATLHLHRWVDLRTEGWLGAEEHVHFERVDASNDTDWLTMLAADGLSHAHFMVLKGANFPGVWATQFAYGPSGEAADGLRLIRPGEEYRDPFQGHINLLGIRHIIEPISTGGLGEPPVADNYPPLHDVLIEARKLDGLGGVAHGAALGRSHTGVADTILGAVDFFEIANTHLYKLDVWYQLLNCGFLVPPLAGTDLPNFPYRDPWQPFLGSVRTYVNTQGKTDFETWKNAVRKGEVFITSGPIIRLRAHGVGPGGSVTLPINGNEVEIEASLESPQSLNTFELILNGEPVPVSIEKQWSGGVHRWRLHHRLPIHQSSWLAVRGSGVPLIDLDRNLNIKQRAVAHSAPIRLDVSGQPITSPSDAKALVQQLKGQKKFYRDQGHYEKPEHLNRVLELFDRAIQKLEPQTHNL